MRPDRYIKQFILPIFNTERTKEIFVLNPTIQPKREEAVKSRIYVYSYNALELQQEEISTTEGCFIYKNSNNISWINVEGLRKQEVEDISQHFGIHNLIVE